jgi:hypothetical protein
MNFIFHICKDPDYSIRMGNFDNTFWKECRIVEDS